VPKKSIIVGVALVALGIIVTFASDSESATSLIPALVGIVLVALGLVAHLKPDLAHHMMHAAAAVAALSILASAGSLIGRGSTGWALIAQVGTVLLCGAFLYAAIVSFRAARASRAG